LLYQRLIRPLLFRFDSETVHHTVSTLTQSVFQVPPARWLANTMMVRNPVQLMGLTFPNRVGLAAGFDKKGVFVHAAAGLGFGHLEVGAVTPLPQPGHPRPRMFRHQEHQALRNRMGFNNDGAAQVARRLAAVKSTIPIGVNLGKGKDTPAELAADDYCATLELLFPYTDFFVLNVSSPNTAGLRALQTEAGTLLAKAAQSNEKQSQRFGLKPRPLLLKISPDLSDQALRSVAQAAVEAGASGIVATNTTVNRNAPYDTIPDVGGLSGGPLRHRSPEVIALLRQTLGPDFPLIGVGGIDCEERARAMFEAGADLIQIYTGFVYQGPGLVPRLARVRKETS
jgi:dihydroorotate dehydrogenase